VRSFKLARWGNGADAVLHAPSVVGGNSVVLSRALNEIEIRSISVAYEDHRFSYGPDVVLWEHKHGLMKRELIRVLGVFRAALGYEIIHFNFGTSMAMPSLPVTRGSTTLQDFLEREVHYAFTELLQVFEILLLRLARRKVFITFQGDDARQGDVSRSIFQESPAHHVGEKYYNSRTDRIKRRRIRRLAKVAIDIFYVNPDLAHVLPERSSFVPYTHVDMSDNSPQLNARADPRKRVLHAPSHRQAKGTQHVINAISRLQAEGYEVDFELLENLPHEQMSSVLRSGDLLIDQLYAGWYGGVAVEALFQGTPVMTFLREEDFNVLPSEMVKDIPIISITTDDIYDQLVKFLAMTRSEIALLRSDSHQFAVRWHNPRTIAQQLSARYFNTAIR